MRRALSLVRIDCLHLLLGLALVGVVATWRIQRYHSPKTHRQMTRSALATDMQVSYALVENMEPLRAINSRIKKEASKRQKPVTGQLLRMPERAFEKNIGKVWAALGPNLNCPTMQRVGDPGGGGKMACGVMTFLRHLHCVVYIFGVGDMSLPSDFIQFTPCEIHVFDPHPMNEDRQELLTMHERVVFHEVGLASKENKPGGHPPYRNVRAIMRDLKHQWVDVMIFNVDGAEVTQLEMLLHERKKEKSDVKVPSSQVLARVHTDSGGGPKQGLQLVESMKDDGFAVFHTEPVWVAEDPLSVVDISFIRAMPDGAIAP
ncbi:hypothetical protein BSKO_08153 [Bryopsis sp. KO-2023]|nr:hypothetical protein BSKO_08153 [Bryopsis sp. KO-2023]